MWIVGFLDLMGFWIDSKYDFSKKECIKFSIYYREQLHPIAH
jgi:hypothetical protein